MAATPPARLKGVRSHAVGQACRGGGACVRLAAKGALQSGRVSMAAAWERHTAPSNRLAVLPSPPCPLQDSSCSWLHIDGSHAAPHSVSFRSASTSPQSYPACLLLLLHLHRPPQVCCRQRPRTRTRCTCVHERINSSGGMPARAYTAQDPAAPQVVRRSKPYSTQGVRNAP
jgi:hypothetical protein